MSGKRFGFRRAIATVAIIVLVTPLVILGVYALGGASSGDREKQRLRELQATQALLYEMVAAAEARIEAQRSIYVTRLRKTEALLRERERELVILRSRLRAVAETPVRTPLIPTHVSD